MSNNTSKLSLEIADVAPNDYYYNNNKLDYSNEIVKETKDSGLLLFILKGEINDFQRNVVMLGEKHLATLDESNAAKKIIPLFSCFGLEGVDVENSIEGKIFFWFAEKIIFKFLMIFTFGHRSQKNISPVQYAYEYAEENNKSIIELEKGYRPSWRNRMLFILLPLIFVYSLYSLTKLGLQASNLGTWNWIYYIIIIFLVVNVYRIPIIGEKIFMIAALVMAYIFDLSLTRNRYMIKNLITAFEENDSIKTILVITGEDHTNDLIKILEKRHNFCGL